MKMVNTLLDASLKFLQYYLLNEAVFSEEEKKLLKHIEVVILGKIKLPLLPF